MIRLLFAIVIAAGVAAPAVAADKAFNGPSSWEKSAGGGNVGGGKSSDVWRKEGQTLAVLHDPSTNANDVVAAVKKNASSGNVTLTKENDVNCIGGKAKVFDMSFGEGSPKTIIRQWIIPEGAGNLRVTYTRIDRQPNQPDVEAAVSAFCGS